MQDAVSKPKRNAENQHTTPNNLTGQDHAEALDRLNKSTWFLLQMIAKNLPEFPSASEQQKLNEFLHLLGELYPSKSGGHRLIDMMVFDPPTLDSQLRFSQWLCKMYYHFNMKVYKPELPCRFDDLYYGCTCRLSDTEGSEGSSSE